MNREVKLIFLIFIFVTRVNTQCYSDTDQINILSNNVVKFIFGYNSDRDKPNYKKDDFNIQQREAMASYRYILKQVTDILNPIKCQDIPWSSTVDERLEIFIKSIYNKLHEFACEICVLPNSQRSIKNSVKAAERVYTVDKLYRVIFIKPEEEFQFPHHQLAIQDWELNSEDVRVDPKEKIPSFITFKSKLENTAGHHISAKSTVRDFLNSYIDSINKLPAYNSNPITDCSEVLGGFVNMFCKTIIIGYYYDVKNKEKENGNISKIQLEKKIFSWILVFFQRPSKLSFFTHLVGTFFRPNAR